MNIIHSEPMEYRLNIFDELTKKHSYTTCFSMWMLPKLGTYISTYEKVVGIMPVYKEEYEA
jgi:hypothetical protein